MIPTSLLHAGHLKDAPAGSFFINGRKDVTGKREVAFVLGENKMAIFPSGGRGWQGFPVEGNKDWEGLIFPDFRVSLDVEQMFDADRRTIASGDVAYIGGVPQLLTNGDVNSFDQTLWLPLTTETENLSNASKHVAFKRWSVFVQDGSEQHVLAEVANGKISGGLANRY